MSKKKKDMIENEVVADASVLVIDQTDGDKIESIPVVNVQNKLRGNAKLPPIEKGIPDGKITFDIFFAYCIKKYPLQVRVDHYRAMKNYLVQKKCATMDTKEGFCLSFKPYGLSIE